MFIGWVFRPFKSSCQPGNRKVCLHGPWGLQLSLAQAAAAPPADGAKRAKRSEEGATNLCGTEPSSQDLLYLVRVPTGGDMLQNASDYIFGHFARYIS